MFRILLFSVLGFACGVVVFLLNLKSQIVLPRAETPIVLESLPTISLPSEVLSKVSVTRAAPLGQKVLLWADEFSSLTDESLLSQYLLMQSNFLHADNGSIRMDWKRNGDSCAGDWRGIERSWQGLPKEIYFEYRVRYEPGFKFDWLYSGESPCRGTAKKLFIIWPNSSEQYRFLFVNENHELKAGSDYNEVVFGGFLPQNLEPKMALEEFGNGEWHTVSFHIKQATTPTGDDGFLYGSIDGVPRWSYPKWASGSTGGWLTFQAPANINEGSPRDQSEWMDDLRIWK